MLEIKKQRAEFPPAAFIIVSPCVNARVTVDIQEAPQIAMPFSVGAGGVLQLHAVNYQPDGGVLTWRIPNPQGVLNLGPLIHTASLTVTAVQPGTETVQVEYLYQGARAQATALVHVLQVDIVQAPATAVRCHLPPAMPNQLPLTAVGRPGNGSYLWHVHNTGILNFQGGLAPGNQAQINVESVAPGTTQVDVQYSLLGVTVADTVTVDVVGVVLTEAPHAALPMHDAGANANTLTLHAQGAPAGGVYAWTIANTGVASFPGAAANAGNLAAVTVESVGAGSTVVTVTYTAAGITATAFLNLHVCRVTIQEAPDHAVVCHAVGAAANTFQLNAQATPLAGGAGNLAWTVHDGSAQVRFQNGLNPGNQNVITLETVSTGTTRVSVNYTLYGCIVTASVRIRVISVTIQPVPEVVMALPAAGIAAATRAIQATGSPPGIGTYAWQLLPHAGAAAVAAQFQGGANPGNNRNATLQTIAGTAGTTDVEVTYTVGAAAARARIECHVVTVSIQQAAAAPPNPQLLKQYAGVPAWGVAAAGPATRGLTAVGLPANCSHGNAGVYAWQAVHAARARFPGGVAPGNNANIQVEAVSASPPYGNQIARFSVTYTLHGVAATATVDVDLVPICSQVLWSPAVNPPVAVAVHVVPQPAPACTHETTHQHPGVGGSAWLAGPGANWPIAGQPGSLTAAAAQAVATVVPADPHHHGGACPVCSAAQLGVVYHFINPNIAANEAVADMFELRNQIRSCVQVWTAAYNAAGGPVGAKRNAANLAVNAWVGPAPAGRNWPWLSSVGGNRINFGVLQLAGPNTRGRMFGVLRGRDAAGNLIRLRGISGVFSLLAGTSARPNSYWSPAVNPTHTIHSATRTSRAYPVAPAANPVGGTFGSCAASKLLTHALHLGLAIDSMAEMWIGATQNGRIDGQLQASCNNCRRYLGEMLCEYGAAARSDAYPAGGVVPDPNGAPPNRGF
ncbi:MAG: hypothetical protein U0Q18_19220 [Bryobacteraceae bacterium]